MTRRGGATLARGRIPGKRPAPPRLWLMTDEARGGAPLAAARRLPPGAGVVLRHYRAPRRRALARALARLCRRRGLALAVGADPRLAAFLGAGLHLPRWARPAGARAPLVTLAVRGARDARRALEARADLLLLSPAFATPSRPGARPLGPVRFGLLARALPAPAAALGGIDAAAARRLRGVAPAALAGVRLGGAE